MNFRSSLSLPSLLTSVVVAGFVTWLLAWHPFSGEKVTEPCLLEMTMGPHAQGRWSLFVDEGHGFPVDRPAETVAESAVASDTDVFSLGVPPGRIREFRAEIDGITDLRVYSARLRTEGGKELVKIPLESLTGVGRTRGDRLQGALEFKAGGAGEPMVLSLRFTPPVVVPSGSEPGWLTVVLVFVATLAGVLLCRALNFEMGWMAQLKVVANRRPKLAILVVAALSTFGSTYPVVFLGKSFVSPNTVAYLLYLGEPTIPGAPREKMEYGAGSDLGATMWQTLPYSAIESQAILRDHEIPLWNRYNSAGLPLLGQGLSMLGDPLHVVPLLAGGAWWAWDLKFVLAKVLFGLGIGLSAWVLTARLGPSLLTAASAAWLGFFAFRFNHPAFFSVCYAPWILLPWLMVARATEPRTLWKCAALLLAADWIELCSGTAKESAVLLLCLNVTGFVAAWRTPRGLKRSVPMAWASVLFLLVSAPCWLVFMDALRQAVTIYDVPRAYQLQPGLLIGFFDSIFSQDFTKQENITHPSANLFVLFGVLWILCQRRYPVNRALAVGAAIAAAFVFGVVPPGWIVRVPFLGRIEHIYNTFGCVLVILSLLLASQGVAACLDEKDPVAWRQTWGRMLMWAAVLLLAYFGFTQAKPQSLFASYHLDPPLHSRFFAVYVPALLMAFGALPWALRWRAKGVTDWGLLGVCLVLLHFRSGMYVATKFDSYVMNPKTGFELAAKSPAVEYVRQNTREPGRVCGIDATLSPGYQGLLGLEGIAGPDALHNPWYDEFCAVAGIQRAWGWRLMVGTETMSRLKPFYDVLNLRYYLRERDGLASPCPGLVLAQRADLDVYESKEAWPRAFFTDHWAGCNSAQEFAGMLGHADGRPFAAVAGQPAAKSPVSFGQRTIGKAENYRLTNNTTEFTVKATGAGVAVLNEVYEADNFRVTVNGITASYFRVNQAFKGVFLPQAGEYRIRFAYWPRMLTAALWISAGGLLLTLITAAGVRRLSWAALPIL